MLHQTTAINKHLTSYMKGLTAKVFRTYNASITFEEQLENRTPKDASVIEKITAYNEANRQVAILCNHQKTVSKTHGASMEKLGNQVCPSSLDDIRSAEVMPGIYLRYELSSTSAVSSAMLCSR